MLEFDEVFLDRMKVLLKDEYEDFLNSLNKPLQKSIYVNQNKIDMDKFLQIANFKTEKIPYENNGLYIDNLKLGKHPLHHAGAFYIQEPSAMFTVNCLKFRGDERVLDMCASPGGKSIQIANRIPNGVLVSNEIVKQRSDVLFSNIERMGLKNVIVTNDTPSRIASAYQDCFDVCLVDAPCSGEGMFRRGSQVVNVWNKNLNTMNSDRQLEILLNADKTLKKNGYLIYSTCTYSYEENEGVIKRFMSLKNYEIINIDYPFTRGVDLCETVRLYPHKVRGEGQFVALLKKKDDNEYVKHSLYKFEKNTKEENIINDFLNKNLIYTKNTNKILSKTANLCKYNKFYYFVLDSEMIRKNINYISLGVRVGEIKKNYFEPNHNLFTAYGSDFKNILNFNHQADEIDKYLKGETLQVDLPNGYGAILVDGCSLGGFKISDGKFKNHYPKGLRNC